MEFYSNIIEEELRKIDLNNFWIFNSQMQPPVKDTPLGKLFHSVRHRYLKAIETAANDEKIVLGISYDSAYSTPSRSIHSSIGSPTTTIDIKNIDINMGHIGLLCFHIIVKCFELLKLKPTDIAETAKRILKEESIAPKLMEKILRRDHQIGDIVIAYSYDLGEIIDSNVSKYGYYSYHVKYLSKPPLDGIDSDWFPAKYVHRLARKSKAREFYISNLKRMEKGHEIIPFVNKMTDETLYESMKLTFTKLAEMGAIPEIIAYNEKRKKMDNKKT